MQITELIELISQQSTLTHYEVYVYGVLCFTVGGMFGAWVWHKLKHRGIEKCK